MFNDNDDDNDDNDDNSDDKNLLHCLTAYDRRHGERQEMVGSYSVKTQCDIINR